MAENMISHPSPSQSSGAEGWVVLNPEVEIHSVEDLKKVFYKNEKTGTVVSAYDALMEQMAMGYMKKLNDQEKHRKEKLKEIQDN